MKKIPLEFPDAIFIDIDNTIYEYNRCHKKAFQETGAYLKDKINLSTDDFIKGYAESRLHVHSRLGCTASSHNRLLYFQHLLEKIDRGPKISLALKLNEIYWGTFIKNIRLFDGVLRFLECAKNLKIPVAFITDMLAEIQFKKMRRLRLENKFDVLVTSEEAGQDKPSPEIFKLAVKKLGYHPRILWMIGDGDDQDIAGGKAIGAMTFQRCDRMDIVRQPKKTKADFAFKSFNVLIDLLSRLKRWKRM